MGDEEVDPRFSADLEPSGRSISSRGSGLLGVVSPVVRDDDSDGDEDEEINREVSFCSRCRSEVGCRRPSFNRWACVCVFALKQQASQLSQLEDEIERLHAQVRRNSLLVSPRLACEPSHVGLLTHWLTCWPPTRLERESHGSN